MNLYKNISICFNLFQFISIYFIINKCLQLWKVDRKGIHKIAHGIYMYKMKAGYYSAIKTLTLIYLPGFDVRHIDLLFFKNPN